MPSQPLPIKSILGRFSSKKMIILPLDLSPEDLKLFVDKFSDQEKVELYCLAELLVFERITNEETTKDLDSLTTLEYLLANLVKEEALARILESNGLRTSIDRINLGRTLKIS